MGRLLAAVCGVLALGVLVAGCGGGGSTTITSSVASTSTISQQDLNAARQAGAQQARVQAKLHRLQQQVKNQGSSNSTTTVETTTPVPTTATVGDSDCGNGISTGPHTSCPFAANVRSAYFQAGGGDITVTAFSPVTGQSYQMVCVVGEATHVCTGPDNIAVYF